MDAATTYNAPLTSLSLQSGGQESEINKSSMSVKTSRDSESTGEIITRFDLDIAYVCEKLTNLNLLAMHVETMETDFDTFESSNMNPDLVIKIVEYDLLSGFLHSELRILEAHVSDLQKEKDNVREFFSLRNVEMEEMLRDSEKSLEQSTEQVLEIKLRSANFEKTLLRLSVDKNSSEVLKLNSNDDDQELEKMNMKTVEHQRHVLRMYGKSLEREMDLEKRASELTQIEETLTMRVRLLEEEVVYAEEEAETTLKRFYETDHASELFIQTSKELIIKIKMLQFNLKGLIQREALLKNELLKLNELCEKVVSLEQELCDVRVKLQHAEACCEANEEEKNMFLSTIKDMGNVIDDLKKKVTQAEIQTDNMEDRCIQLSEANAELKKELKFAKGKVKNLETSLNQMEEAKNASAKDINICSEFITDLVVQMKLERERLQKQISSLKHENKILVNCLNKKGKDSTVKENEGALSTDFEVEAAREETVTDSTEVARDIDARQLKTKDILLVFLILIIPLTGVLIYQTQV